MSTFVYMGQVVGQANVYVDKNSNKMLVKIDGCEITKSIFSILSKYVFKNQANF